MAGYCMSRGLRAEGLGIGHGKGSAADAWLLHRLHSSSGRAGDHPSDGDRAGAGISTQWGLRHLLSHPRSEGGRLTGNAEKLPTWFLSGVLSDKVQIPSQGHAESSSIKLPAIDHAGCVAIAWSLLPNRPVNPSKKC